jgi:anti-sigma factor RsiW
MDGDRHEHQVRQTPCSQEGRANAFLDGELPRREYAAFFAHVASCAACREVLEVGLAFRRMLRHERLAVPPAMDEHFLGRLSEQQERNAQVNRRADRYPLWHARRPVSAGVALTAAVVIFIAGFLSSGSPTPQPTEATPVTVEGFEERIAFRQFDATRPPSQPAASPSAAQPIYVYYPGITVEASRLTDP